MKASLLFFIFALSFQAQGEWVLRNPKVEFTATGRPAMIKIKGEGNGLKIKSEDARSGSFQFELATLKTGIKTRDEHMKNKYLEIGKFPVAEFSFKEFDPAQSLVGRLKLHGVEQNVPVRITKSGAHYLAEFEIKLSDFQIELPSFAGIKVADLVRVTTEFEAEEKK